MKSIFLSVVIICALVIAGIGGTLAGFSDTEQSNGNSIVTGGLDLTVNGLDDLPYGLGVPALVAFTDIQPGQWYEKTITLSNLGQSVLPNGANDTAYAFIEFKNMKCDNVNPKHPYYIDKWYTSPISQTGKLEPELVAEYGGVLDQVDILGKNWAGTAANPDNPTKAYGQTGDNCCLTSTIDVLMYFDGVQIYNDKIGTLLNKKIYLGECPPCGSQHSLLLKFRLPQVKDTAWIGQKGYDFEYWPTNAFMVDKVSWDMMFILTEDSESVPVVPPIGH